MYTTRYDPFSATAVTLVTKWKTNPVSLIFLAHGQSNPYFILSIHGENAWKRKIVYEKETAGEGT